ncbi:hypothetical protein WISP_46229 [Willisornis vidua]|uniref:Reverse transcriptase domain-containing protein n=1 Tax=Willisornis vidua TaxID=1566151 RepID=A0ABQ9DI78_9PASS|nr:hypothetical protein WISP_46229 [Willisornis vidua]
MSRGNLEKKLWKVFKWHEYRSELLRPEPDMPQLEKVDRPQEPKCGISWPNMEDMEQWERKPTCALAVQVRELKENGRRLVRYIDDIIIWKDTAEEAFENGKKIIQILLGDSFTIKQSKVKGPAREFQFLGVKWQDRCCQIPTQVITKITAMSPPMSKKETEAFLGAISYRGSEANTLTDKEILATYEGVQAASEVIGTGAQLFLAPRLPVLKWVLAGQAASTHHAIDAHWSKWIALILQRTCVEKPNHPGILEIIMNWPKGENFGLADEEKEE